ncbi:MAG: CapA family protein [Prevotella sp.]|nr:CapA family protein [Bacteroides sp.]MCM1366357.1 CapA family protein [Prevotella sp.]
MKTLSIAFLLCISMLGACSKANSASTNDTTSVKEENSISKDSITLLFVGDAMQHEGQLNQAKLVGNGKHNYDGCFDLIAPFIKEADYAVVNLEVPLGGGPTYRGYPCFSAPDSYAAALRDAGFDLFLTANNHCLDSGDKAARRTLSALDSLKVDHIGTYHDANSREKLVPFIKDIGGYKIGFLNYTYGTNGIEPKAGMEVAMIDRDKMAQEIKKTRQAGAELIVVTVHWGIEYVLHENENQRSLAQFLIDQDVDLIIGGHPHVIQPMKVVRNEKSGKNVLVVYSLGNFISNMKTGDTRGGALVRANIKRDKNGDAHFSSADYDTFFSAKPTGKTDNYRVIPSWMSDKIPSGQQDHWRIFNSAARKVFNAENVNVPAIQH